LAISRTGISSVPPGDQPCAGWMRGNVIAVGSILGRLSRRPLDPRAGLSRHPEIPPSETLLIGARRGIGYVKQQRIDSARVWLHLDDSIVKPASAPAIRGGAKD
jgi:hypothetical protein